MGASPTKKKTVSPSKVPKAQPLFFENDTLMQLQSSKRLNELTPEKKEVKVIEEIEDEDLFTEK